MDLAKRQSRGATASLAADEEQRPGDDLDVDDDQDLGGDVIISAVLIRQEVGVAVYDGLRGAVYTAQLSASPATLHERLEVNRQNSSHSRVEFFKCKKMSTLHF